MSLNEEYAKLVASGKVRDDIAQRRVLEQLEQLRLLLEQKLLSDKKLLNKIIPFPTKNHGIKGLYIHGDVGRGKSMVMDLFFNNLCVKKKKRIHFHAFMIEIHASLHKWRQDNRNNVTASDPIAPLARDIAKKVTMLCFDEMQVSDIADAMILSRLFLELFKNGVVVVATSNRHPDDLYKDGLQRERFMPFIALIKEKMQVANLAANEDYRLIHLKALERVYYFPLDKNSHKFMENVFSELTNAAKYSAFTFDIAGRKVVIPKTYNDIAWVKFTDLCEKPLGAADYIEIAREFGTLLLEGVPQMGREQRNEAKRFVTLIDALYEHKVKLIVTAAAKPEEIYKEGDGSFEFQRTVSRLIEMQSEQYLVAGHVS